MPDLVHGAALVRMAPIVFHFLHRPLILSVTRIIIKSKYLYTYLYNFLKQKSVSLDVEFVIFFQKINSVKHKLQHIPMHCYLEGRFTVLNGDYSLVSGHKPDFLALNFGK